MALELHYVPGSTQSALPDNQSVDFARRILSSYKTLLNRYDNPSSQAYMSNVLTWDAYRMLLLTEFPEVIKHVKWYINGNRIQMTDTMSYVEYAPEHGIAGTIAATIIRHNIEKRKNKCSTDIIK